MTDLMLERFVELANSQRSLQEMKEEIASWDVKLDITSLLLALKADTEQEETNRVCRKLEPQNFRRACMRFQEAQPNLQKVADGKARVFLANDAQEDRDAVIKWLGNSFDKLNNYEVFALMNIAALFMSGGVSVPMQLASAAGPLATRALKELGIYVERQKSPQSKEVTMVSTSDPILSIASLAIQATHLKSQSSAKYSVELANKTLALCEQAAIKAAASPDYLQALRNVKKAMPWMLRTAN